MSNGIRPQKWKFTQFSVEWSALSGGHGWPFEFLKFSWMVLFVEKQSHACYKIRSVLTTDYGSPITLDLYEQSLVSTAQSITLKIDKRMVLEEVVLFNQHGSEFYDYNNAPLQCVSFKQ